MTVLPLLWKLPPVRALGEVADQQYPQILIHGRSTSRRARELQTQLRSCGTLPSACKRNLEEEREVYSALDMTPLGYIVTRLRVFKGVCHQMVSKEKQACQRQWWWWLKQSAGRQRCARIGSALWAPCLPTVLQTPYTFKTTKNAVRVDQSIAPLEVPLCRSPLVIWLSNVWLLGVGAAIQRPRELFGVPPVSAMKNTTAYFPLAGRPIYLWSAGLKYRDQTISPFSNDSPGQ